MPCRTLLASLFLAAAALAPGLVPVASAQVLFPIFDSNGFEPPGYVLGNANGQNGWTAAGSIVNTVVQSGTQGARAHGGPATGFSRALSVAFAGQKLVLDVDVNRVTSGRTIFWIGNNFFGPMAYIGIAAGNAGYMLGNPSGGDQTAQHSNLPANEWRHLRLEYDLYTGVGTGYVDGLPLGTVPLIIVSGFPPTLLNIAVGEINQDVYFDNVKLSNAADYAVSTAGGVMTATDFSGQNDSLTISQPAANTVKFVGPKRRFTVNNGPILYGETGNVSLAGISSFTVNTGAGNDTITVSGPINPLPAFTVNGDTGDDLVTLTGALTLATDASLDLDLVDDDASSGVDAITLAPGAEVAALGSGAITFRCSRNVTVGDSASLETVNGNLVVEANMPPAAPTSGSFVGVFVDTATVRSTGTGQVSIAGRGGNVSDRQYGVLVQGGGGIIGGTSGTLLVDGIGGASTGFLMGGVGVRNSTVSSLGADVVVTGQGGGDPLVAPALAANIGVLVSESEVTAGGTATVTVQGTGGAGPGSNNIGVQVQTNSLITSGGGNVTLTGQAGGSLTSGAAFHGGVAIIVGSQITAGGNGTVTVEGTGGAGPGDTHRGVEVSGGGLITSGGGQVSVTGTGGAGVGNAQLGVTAIDGSITSGGGPVFVTGHGGYSGGGVNQIGVLLQLGGFVTSGGGDIHITGTHGGGSASYGIYDNNSGITGVSTVANGGDIELVADLMAWVSTSRIAAPADGIIRIRPLTPGRDIDVLNDVLWDSFNALAMPDVMLNSVNAGTIEIGSADAGDMYVAGAMVYQPAAAPQLGASAASEVSAPATTVALPKGLAGRLQPARGPKAAPGISPALVQAATPLLDTEAAIAMPLPQRAAAPASPTATHLVTSNFVLQAGGDIQFLSMGTPNDGFDTGGGSLLMSSGVSGAIVPAPLDTDVTATNLSMGPGTTLLVTIDSTTAGTGYQQLTVAGPVDLSNVSLDFTGTYVPVEGDSFTIVRNGASPTTGTIAGLPEGATIPNFMGSALGASITYEAGPDDDVLVVVTGTVSTPGPGEQLLPRVTRLSAPRPSPFISSTNLSFALAVRGHAELAIFSVDGRRVRTLANGAYEPGEYQMRWDGRGDHGGRAGAGVYFVRLTTPQGEFHRRVVLLQ